MPKLEISKRNVLFLLIMLCGLTACFYLKFNPVQFVKCVSTGGSYEKPVGPLDARMSDSYCVHSFSDGGKVCKSSNECEGRCLISYENESDKEYSPKAEDIELHGKCEENNRFDGCFPGTIEDPFSYCS